MLEKLYIRPAGRRTMMMMTMMMEGMTMMLILMLVMMITIVRARSYLFLRASYTAGSMAGLGFSMAVLGLRFPP